MAEAGREELIAGPAVVRERDRSPARGRVVLTVEALRFQPTDGGAGRFDLPLGAVEIEPVEGLRRGVGLRAEGRRLSLEGPLAGPLAVALPALRRREITAEELLEAPPLPALVLELGRLPARGALLVAPRLVSFFPTGPMGVGPRDAFSVPTAALLDVRLGDAPVRRLRLRAVDEEHAIRVSPPELAVDRLRLALRDCRPRGLPALDGDGVVAGTAAAQAWYERLRSPELPRARVRLLAPVVAEVPGVLWRAWLALTEDRVAVMPAVLGGPAVRHWDLDALGEVQVDGEPLELGQGESRLRIRSRAGERLPRRFAAALSRARAARAEGPDSSELVAGPRRDRRASGRVALIDPVPVTVWVDTPGGSLDRRDASLTSLSEGGLSLAVEAPLPEDAELEVVLPTSEDEDLKLPVRVSWARTSTDGGWEVGARIAGLAPEARPRLALLCGRLEAAQPGPPARTADAERPLFDPPDA